MDKINETLKSLLDTHINRIIEVLKQPTIFSDLLNIRKCAELYKKYLQEAGFQKAILIETDRSPLVYGEYDCNASKTVLVYNFFDMLPMEHETYEFKSEITTLEQFGRCITGRGIGTKGPGVAFINAVEGCLKAKGTMPVNVIFLAEGEEMYGSNHIPWFIEKYRKSLSNVDAVFVPSMSQNQDGNIRSINLGGKGFLGFELMCTGKDWGRGPKEHDVHSSTKAIVDSPMWRLIEAINTLVNNSGQKILIDGFYENVWPITKLEKEIANKVFETFNEEAQKKRLSIDRFLNDAEGIDIVIQNLFKPTLNVEGIPYTSIDPVGVIAHEAVAKFQSRIVANQTVDEILKKIRSHLDNRGYNDIKIKKLYGFGPGRTGLDEPIVQAILKLYQDAGLEKPIATLSPASAPVNALNNTLGIPCAGGGLGHIGREKNIEYLVIDEQNKVSGLVGNERSYIQILDNFINLSSTQ